MTSEEIVMNNRKKRIGKLLSEVIFNSRMEGDFHCVYESDICEGGYLSHIDIPKNLKGISPMDLKGDEVKQINKGIHKHLCKSVDSINDVDRLNSIKELIIKSQKTEKMGFKLVESFYDFLEVSPKDLYFDTFDVWDVLTDCVISIVEKIKEYRNEK